MIWSIPWSSHAQLCGSPLTSLQPVSDTARINKWWLNYVAKAVLDIPEYLGHGVIALQIEIQNLLCKKEIRVENLKWTILYFHQLAKILLSYQLAKILLSYQA